MDSFLAVVRALSHRDRVRVVKLLGLGSLSAIELAEVMDQSEASVRDHLSVLVQADLVVSVEGEGDECFRINPDRSNLYGAVLLALLEGWLDDEADIEEDRRRAERGLGRRA